MKHSIKSELVILAVCLIIMPVTLLFTGEWAQLVYMKHLFPRKYSYLDQGKTQSGRHCFTVTDATDSKFIKSVSLTELQERFLEPKQ